MTAALQIVTERPKAIATGKLFGTTECYVLDDGRRVLSQRGAGRAISAKEGGTESHNLGRLLSRLPSEYEHLRAAPFFEFSRPNGTAALAIDSSVFVDILNAYVELGIAGALTKHQIHLARNSQAILKALQKVGLDALIDEATGYQDLRADDALLSRFQQFLSEAMGEHAVRFTPRLVRSLCTVYGKTYEGGRLPRWLASPIRKLYDVLYGVDIATELKRRNPSPRMGSNHHQWFREPEMLKLDLNTVEALATTAVSRRDFWQKVYSYFKRTPMQGALTFDDGR